MTTTPERAAEIQQAYRKARDDMITLTRERRDTPPPPRPEPVTRLEKIAADVAHKTGLLMVNDWLGKRLDVLYEHRDALRDRDRDRVVTALREHARYVNAWADRIAEPRKDQT